MASPAVYALIPARLGSTRFPEKMLANLAGKPLIVRTCEAVVKTGLFDQVLVVTDHERIRQAVQAHGCQAVMSRNDHPSGSDRIAEIAQTLPSGSLLVNVQGDEPFTQKAPLEALIAAFRDTQVVVASLMRPLTEVAALSNPNVVKVTINAQNDALCFSRAPIPFDRDSQGQNLVPGMHFQHIGIYAYRREALLKFTSLPPCPLELTEKLEQLRLLYHGINIRMVVTEEAFIGVDTVEDLERATAKFIMG